MVKIKEELELVAAQWDTMKSADADRQILVDRILSMVHDSKLEIERLQNKIERLEFHELNYLAERKRLMEENNAFGKRLNTAPFVLVLVDGDNTHFKDEFLKTGSEGGQMAAQRFKREIKVYLDEHLGPQDHRDIVVRIYANLAGLVQTYVNNRIIPSARVAQNFIIGFNSVFPLFEFVDVGDDKEAADNKIKGNFSLYWRNEHCKNILLAGLTDQGYFNFLKQFNDGSEKAEKLTLIQAIPFSPVYDQLATNFRIQKFDSLFRDTALPPHFKTVVKETPQKDSYAAATARPRDRTTPQSSSQASPTVAGPAEIDSQTSAPRQMSFNQTNQRIDKSIAPWDPVIVKRLESGSYCHRYFLSNCYNLDCEYAHTPPLGKAEKRALARIARMLPCVNGTKCDDPDCVAGHQCFYQERCWYRRTCKFKPEMHGVDSTVFKTV